MNTHESAEKGERAPSVRIPKHVAIIMDGNGRWATQRYLPRTAGHKQGRETAHRIVKATAERGIPILTLFAFGKENWKRPRQEIRTLFRLFFLALNREVALLHENNIRVRIIGDKAELPKLLQSAIVKAEQLTENNTGLQLNIVINYSGRWDILQAVKNTALNLATDLEKQFENSLCFAGIDEPDLLIRTADVQRLSNFMLWDLAYTELYFSKKLWPDFSESDFENALLFYTQQERRFGLTSEQLEKVYA